MKNKMFHKILAFALTAVMLTGSVDAEKVFGETARQGESSEVVAAEGNAEAASEEELAAVLYGDDDRDVSPTAPAGYTPAKTYPASASLYNQQKEVVDTIKTELTAKLSALPDTRDQGSYDTGWSHAAIALAELYKKNDVPLASYETVQYSERHLSYYTYHNGAAFLDGQSGDKVILKDTTGADVSGNEKLNLNGSLEDAIDTLSRWRGVAEETVAYYPGTTTESVNWTDEDGVEQKDILHLTDAYQLDLKNDASDVKYWINHHGGAAVSYKYDANFYLQDNNAYYNSDNTGNDHHAVLVGWDDQFPKELFTVSGNGAVAPENDGAWLVRNSRGTLGQILSGGRYFWISYEDKSLSKKAYAAAFRMISEDAKAQHYFYDSQTSGHGRYDVSGTAFHAANIYTVPQVRAELSAGAYVPQQLREISFRTDSTSGTASVKVYRLGSTWSNPQDGTLIAEESISISCPGRYTVPILNDTNIDKDDLKFLAGEKFSVVVTLSDGTTASYEAPRTLPLYADGTAEGTLVSEVGINEGESFLGSTASDGQTITWEDLKKKANYTGGNFCISAVSVNTGTDLKEATVTVNETYTYNQEEKKPHPTVKVNGTELVEDVDYSLSWSNNINAGSGTVTVTADPDSVLYYGSVDKDFVIQQIDLGDANLVDITLGDELTYNGSLQTKEVREVKIRSNGKIISPNDYEVLNNQQTDASDDYQLMVKAVEGGNCKNGRVMNFVIKKAEYYPDNLVGIAKSGKTGTVELSGEVGAGWVLSGNVIVQSDNDKILDGTPVVEGTTLHFKLTGNRVGDVGMAVVQVYVNGDNNHKGYSILVEIYMSQKSVQTLRFPNLDSGAVQKTYGDDDFIYQAVVMQSGGNKGEVTYISTNPDVAEVEVNTGKVHINGIGTTTITATAAETEDYLRAQLSYSLVIGKRGVTIEGLYAENKTYDGNSIAKVKGDPEIVGLLAADREVVSVVNGAATFADPEPGTGKAVKFSGYALTDSVNGAKVRNYTLVSQPPSVTASITKIPADRVTVEDTYLDVIYTKATAEIYLGDKLGKLSYDPGNVVYLGGTIQTTGSVTVAANFVTNDGQATLYLQNGRKGDTITYPVTIRSDHYEDVVTTVYITLVADPEAIDVSDANVTIKGVYRYTGKAVRPADSDIIVTMPDGEVLTSGTQYTVTVTDNINAGIACVTVSGVEPVYTGETKGYFKILPIELKIVGAVVKNGGRVYEKRNTQVEIEGVSFRNADNQSEVALTPGTDYTAEGSMEDDSVGVDKPVTVTVTLNNTNYNLKTSIYTRNMKATITKASKENGLVELGVSTRYGRTAALDLLPAIEAGGTVGEIRDLSHEELFSAIPALNNAHTELGYTIADDEDLAGLSATLFLPVTGCENYYDYRIQVRITVAGCEHPSTELQNIIAPTCTEEGWTGDEVCTVCGEIVKTGTVRPALGHLYEETSYISPTAYTQGMVKKTCKRCGDAVTEILDPDASVDPVSYEDLLVDADSVTPDQTTSKNEKDETLHTSTVLVSGKQVLTSVMNENTGEVQEESSIWIAGIDTSYAYQGGAVTPEVHVYDGVTKLKEKSDYTVSYKNNKNAGEAAAEISFKGNYSGTPKESISFTIDPAVIGTDVIVKDVSVAYTRRTLKPVPAILWAESGKPVNKSNFSIGYSDTILEPGNYKIYVAPQNDNFTGDAQVTARVVEDVGQDLSKARVTVNPKKSTYTGQEIVPTFQVKMPDGTVPDANKYEVQLFNNVEPGTAIAVFTGKGTDCVGSKTVTFTITKGRELNRMEGFSYEFDAKVPYQKSGARPAVTVKDGSLVLTEGKDYTVSYSNNKGITKAAQLTVKGKGNYKSSVKYNYEIVKQDLNELDIKVEDKIKSKKGYKNPVVSITDLDGKKLQAGKDYKLLDDYTGPDDSNLVTVTIQGLGNYEGSFPAVYRYVSSALQLSKVRAGDKIADQEYNGRPVTLTDNDLKTVLYNNTAQNPVYLDPGEDFIVTGYQNNTKKGTAKVILQGIGNYGGSRTLNFKIREKEGFFAGIYRNGVWSY